MFLGLQQCWIRPSSPESGKTMFQESEQCYRWKSAVISGYRPLSLARARGHPIPRVETLGWPPLSLRDG